MLGNTLHKNGSEFQKDIIFTWCVELCFPFRSVRIGFQTDPLFEEWPGWVWFELCFGFETVGSVDFFVVRKAEKAASVLEFTSTHIQDIRLIH